MGYMEDRNGKEKGFLFVSTWKERQKESHQWQQLCGDSLFSIMESFAQELELILGQLSSLIQKHAQILLHPPPGVTVADASSAKIAEHRSKISAITDIILRRNLKIVFFGRTSSGKSSAINALLGSKILPTGLGHTTSCFINIKGTYGDNPKLSVPYDNDEGSIEVDIR